MLTTVGDFYIESKQSFLVDRHHLSYDTFTTVLLYTSFIGNKLTLVSIYYRCSVIYLVMNSMVRVIR